MYRIAPMAIMKLRRIVTVVAVIVIFVCCNALINWENISSMRYFTSNESQPPSRANPPQSKQHKIGFLKTHKCASSTIQNILFRFAFRHDLNLILPAQHNYVGRGQTFNRSLISDLPWSSLQYDIFALHTRWHQNEIEETIGNKQTAKFVTILRDPVIQFESLFYYLNLAPFYKVTDLEDFVWNAMNGSTRYDIFGRNQMLYDSGLDVTLFDDVHAISNHVHNMEANFDLVMLVEDMYPSLLLLKDLLNWDFEDIIPVHKNKGMKKPLLTDLARNKLRYWLRGDQILYDHFKNILQKKKERYGLRKLSEDVEKLQNLGTDVKNICNGVEANGIVVHGLPCRSFNIPELQFIEYFRTKQRTKVFTTF